MTHCDEEEKIATAIHQSEVANVENGSRLAGNDPARPDQQWRSELQDKEAPLQMDAAHIPVPTDLDTHSALSDRPGAGRSRDDLASVRGLVLSLAASALIYLLLAKLLLPLF